MKKLLIFILLILSPSTFAVINGESKEWLSLLRYKKNLLGNYKSEIDDPSYFISKDGKNNPSMELKKTIEFFNKNLNKDLICKYPARLMLLSKHKLIKNNFKTFNCKKYNKLSKKLKLESVSLIFSSYFINSPASAFGHTFLRLTSKDSAVFSNDLLDFGLDFSAQVTTKNPILYGILGITGGFKGRFKLMPYYYKVREYNNLESRDLWNFKLNFSKDELNYFIAQLVELEQVYFDYFYLTENCSYHILSLINAVRPSLNLMNNLNGLVVPPVDTLYALKKDKTFINKVEYRPSIFKEMLTRINSLNKKEKKLLKKIIKNNNYKKVLDIKIPDNNKLKVLEAYSLYIDYKESKLHYGSKNQKRKNAISKKMDFNLYRSQLKGELDALDYSKDLKNSPLKGHYSQKVKIAFKNFNQASFKNKGHLFLEYRFALHDYLQKHQGFIPFSTTEMGKLNIEINKDKVKFNQFEVVNVEALRPLNLIEQKMSWRFSFGLMDNEFTYKQFIIPYFNLSLGQSYRFYNFVISPFIRAENSFSKSYHSKYLLNLGPNILIVYNGGLFSASLDFSRFKVFKQEYSYQSSLTANVQLNISKNTALFINYKNIKRDHLLESYMLGFSFNF